MPEHHHLLTRRGFLRGSLGAAALAAGLGATPGCARLSRGARRSGPPNLVIIFTDDQGYGDIGCYGAEGFDTPNLDAMADEGLRFTDFYVAAPVCTPSRAALMTGCYPKRVSLAHRVIFPYSEHGLHPDEVTLAELLQAQGYATACIGKWHLGHHEPLLPTRQGFDYYFGIPYSNDMGSHHYRHLDYTSPPLPVMRQEEVIGESPAQAHLTRRFTEEAVRYIRAQRDQPFFLYLSHAMPHRPIDASRWFKGTTEHGLYGDVIAELDWSTGMVLEELDRQGLAENTWVVFTSDNGPRMWEGIRDGYRSGSAGPLRGQKNTTWEGGMRVPCIMRWPGVIPAGRDCTTMTTAMDILPTMAGFAGTVPPQDRIIDGHDITEIITAEPGAPSPYDAFFYYRDDRLQAVRSGPWKLHVYRPEWDGELRAPLLFNLDEDIGESRDVAAQHPDVVARLQDHAERAREDMGDAVTGAEGANVRPVGRV